MRRCIGSSSSFVGRRTQSALLVACAGSIGAQKRSFLHASLLLPKDVKGMGGRSKGSARPLSFDERSDRRSGKSREFKEEAEALKSEAEDFANEGFDGELEDLYLRYHTRCMIQVNKVTNVAKCIETLEIEAPGGRKVPVLQTGTITKPSATEVQITLTNKSFATPIVQKLSRFDNTLSVSRDESNINIKIPPTTKVRREKAAGEIKAAIVDFRLKIKVLRTKAMKYIQSIGIDDMLSKEHLRVIDEKGTQFMNEKIGVMEDMAESIVTADQDDKDETSPEEQPAP